MREEERSRGGCGHTLLSIPTLPSRFVRYKHLLLRPLLLRPRVLQLDLLLAELLKLVRLHVQLHIRCSVIVVERPDGRSWGGCPAGYWWRVGSCAMWMVRGHAGDYGIM